MVDSQNKSRDATRRERTPQAFQRFRTGGTPDRVLIKKKKAMLVCVLVLFSVHDVAMIDVRHGKILEYFSMAKSQEKMVVSMEVLKTVGNPVSRSKHCALSMKQNLSNSVVCELKLKNELKESIEENFSVFMSQVEHEAQKREIPSISWINARQIMNLRHGYKTVNEPLAVRCTRHEFVSKQTMFVMTLYMSASLYLKEAKTTAKMCVKSDTLPSLMQMMKLFKLHHAYLKSILSFTYVPMQSKMLMDRTIRQQSQTIRASQISPNTRKNCENTTNLACMVEFNSNDKKVVQELVLFLIIRKAPKQAKMESKTCLQKLMQRNSTLHTATSELKIATSLQGERYTAALLSLRQDDHHASSRSTKQTAAQKSMS